MIEQTISVTTLAEFEAFVLRPENSEKRFELVMGEIVRVPSNAYVSAIAVTIAFYIKLFLMENKIGQLTGEGGGYIVNGQVYAPDVAYISYETQPMLERSGFNPVPPDLAVEIISDPNNASEINTLRLKVHNYQMAGVVVWVIDPFAKTAEIYTDGQLEMVVGDDGVIDGGVVLPGFTLALKDIFSEAPSDES